MLSFVRDGMRGLMMLWGNRPQFVVFPQDEGGFDIDNQYYIGNSGLLVRPVTEQGATEASVYLSDKQVRIHILLNRLSRLTWSCFQPGLLQLLHPKGLLRRAEDYHRPSTSRPPPSFHPRRLYHPYARTTEALVAPHAEGPIHAAGGS